MSWGWLNSPAVFLVGFIATLIGIPPSVAAIVAFVRPVVRRAMSRRAEKSAVQSGATVSLARPRKTGGAFPTVGSVGRVASTTSASSPLTTITFKSEPEWYEVGLSQPTPWEGQARGGFAVYPGGL